MLLCTFLQGTAQHAERIAAIRSQLEMLAKEQVLGLNEKADISVSGVSIQEFLRGIAQSHKLNINIDPSLNIKVYNRFTNENVSTIIIFLCEEYGLDIRFTGSIMSFYKPEQKPIEAETPKERIPEMEYNKGADKLSFDLQQDDLQKVAKKVVELTGKNIIVSPTVGEKQITIFMKDAPFESAIENLALANGLTMMKNDDGVYLLTKVDDPANANGKGGRNTSGSNRGKGQTSNSSDYIQVQQAGDGKINIDVVDAPIADLIKIVSDELKKDYFLFSEPAGNTTSRVNNVTYEEFLSYLLKGTEFTFKNDNELFLIGERKHETLRNTKVIKLQYRPAEALIEAIPSDIKQGVQITPFPELNSVILSGSNPAIMEVEYFIKEMDKLVPMVLIEVILVEVRKGKTIKTGVQAGISDSTVNSGGTLLPGVDFTLSTQTINDLLSLGGPLNLGKVTPNFYLSLTALEANENINITSTPKLATLNGHEATLSIGRTSYYLVEQTNSSTGLTPVLTTNQQWNSVQANLDITIKPIVSGDEQVTLDIDVSNSDFTGESAENRPPNTINSSFKSMIRVKNEEMVVLGGLEKETKSESGSGTPILSRIPVIKWFFSSKSKTKSREKSLVFIKPTVIY